MGKPIGWDSWVAEHGVMPVHKSMMIFRSFLESDEIASDVHGFINDSLHAAHRMYRDGSISGDEFAMIMDEVICY